MQMILLDGKKCNRSCRVKKIDKSLMGEQGESKVENRLRMEGRGIGKDKGFKEERNGTGKRKNKLQTLRALRLVDVLLQDRAPQHSLVSRNYIKK